MMKKQLKRVFLFAIVAFSVACSDAENSNDGRQIEAFNSHWHFKLAENVDVANKNEEPDSTWRLLNLPHDWSIEGDFSPDHPATVGGGALPGGIGWYRKSFKIEGSDSSQLMSILFDGVYMNSEVWINGHHLGKRPNGYIGFSYDLTPHLNYGSEANEILVKVDNSQQPNSRWYSGSGIYRNVWLITTDKLHVAQWGTFVTTPQVSEDNATIAVEVNVKNEYKKPKNATLTSFIADNGEKLASAGPHNFTIEAGQKIKLDQSFSLDNPKRWSVEQPHLYTVLTELAIDGTVVDQYETPVGIRSFRFDLEEGFILNGESVKIKGVCLHHDLGPLGAAVNTRAIERQLEIMQKMGVNGIRTAHNPPAPELLDLCDQMGFIVMDEAFDIWESSKTTFDYGNEWDEWHKKDLEDQILRDRNHPSIFMWSIGNEVHEQWNERGAEIGRELAAIVKNLDSTRLVTAGMNPPIHVNDSDVTIQFEETAAEPNALAGSGALDIIGYNYAHQTYENHQKNFPNTPFIATETTSALATRGYYEFPSDTTKIWPLSWDKVFTQGNPDNTVSAFDQVRTPWGSLHETTWKIIKKHDFLAGFYIWTGFDYLGEPTPYTWPSRSSYFGIVDLAGFPKDAYYMYKSEWTKDTVLHILPHWNWEKGQTVDVWAYYNHADEVELFLNGKSIGKKRKEGDDLHVMWRFPFEAGTLTAKSYKNDQLVKEVKVKTAGEAAKLHLHADRKTIKADGKDLSFITVTVIDKDGVMAPKAGNNIKFSLEGNGEIVGVASGDPTNHQPFKGKEHKALNGKCLVIVQSDRKPGTITIKASAEGLETSSISIISE